jgi:gas vesicle protein
MTHEDDQDRDSGTAFITGLVAGALIGAGFGVLFAPRRGAELRRQVAESASNVGQTVAKTVDEFSEQGRAAYGRVRDVAARAGSFVDRVADPAKNEETNPSFGDMAPTASTRI